MTRLFLRFYVGVILILLVAWMIQGYLFRTRSEADNTRVVESALSGGVRMGRYHIEKNWNTDRQGALDDLRIAFDYEVNVVPVGKRSLNATSRQRLTDGDEVLIYGDRIVVIIPGTDHLLEFGPLPRFSGPSRAEILVGLGLISLLAAVAIAVLLRPVALQLRAVETAATKISNGDLDARVDAERWPRSLPLASAFNDMATRTQGLLQSQRELLQAVSHELRTPLARIRFGTDLIQTAKTDQERAERLASVDRATVELDQLVGELLTYARLDSDARRSESEPIPVMDLLHDVVADQQVLSPGIQFDVVPNVADDHPNATEWTVHADSAGLTRAVKNLVANAAKYAGSNVQLSVTRQGNQLFINVDDDGPGVAVEHREKIFEPFVRLDNEATKGVGLGLALVQRIMQRIGGTITVGDSALGGARFQMSLMTN